MGTKLEEYKIWRLGGKHYEELIELVAVFYDLSLAKEFVNAEHSGWNTEYAIQHNGEIIYSEF